MQDLGCSLIGLDLGHPEPDRLDAALDAIILDRNGAVRVQVDPFGPCLSASIRTPAGVAILRS